MSAVLIDASGPTLCTAAWFGVFLPSIASFSQSDVDLKVFATSRIPVEISINSSRSNPAGTIADSTLSYNHINQTEKSTNIR